jgi:hypothetical protein
MTDTMIAHLNRDISSYLESIGEDAQVEQPKKKVKTRDRIIELLRENPKAFSTASAPTKVASGKLLRVLN